MRNNDAKKIINYAGLIGMGIIALVLGFLFGFRVFQPTASAKMMKSLPKYGWTVREDLGVGQVPNGPIAHRFIMWHSAGWRITVYCLDQTLRPPAVGTICNMIDKDTFWCGDEVQPLRKYEIRQTPPPPPTRTPTATSTTTYTPTATSTNTPTATQTLTATWTPEPTVTFTPPVATPTPRPKMGGEGNFKPGDILRGIIGLSLVALGGILVIIERSRRSVRHKK
ncbi:MAG: hypothetical protein ACOX7C_08330 [Brevefilum sp.]